MATEYVVANNCKLLVDNGKPVKLTINDAKKVFGEDVKLDNRLFILSVNNTYDREEYLNYLNFIRTASNRSNISASVVNNFTTMLDLGYVPIWMPPTFFNEGPDKVINALSSKGLTDYVREKPLRLTGTQVNSKPTDVWLSRLSVGKIFNGKMTGIPITSLYEEVMS